MSYNIYPTVPSVPEDPEQDSISGAHPGPQVAYHLNIIQSKRQGLLKLEKRYKKKSKKYPKILNRLTWLNACSSGLTVATGISSGATLSTLISLPVSIPLGAVSLAGASVSGVATALTKKYQKKLSKVMKLYDIVTSAIAVFERVVSKALRNGKVGEEEFDVVRTFHLKTMDGLTSIDHKMGAENRSQFAKNTLEGINEMKRNVGTRV